MRRRFFVVAAAALVALPACGDLLDPAAAVVYGEKIPIEDVQEEVDEFLESDSYKELAAQGDGPAFEREAEQRRLTDLIRRAVLAPVAQEHGIEVTEADVDEAVDAFVDAQLEGQRGRLEEDLKERGLTEAQFRDIMYDQILHDSLRAEITADVQPSEEDVRAFYEDNRAEYRTTRAQHILVEDRALADQLAARLQGANAGNVEDLFADLARRHSLDPGSARKGGDLGYQPAGTFVEPFENALARMGEGEISDPVKTEFGWHVLYLADVRVEPFERVRAGIEQQLVGETQDEVWSEYLRELFEEADIEVNPRYGVFDEELFGVVDPDADDIPAGEAPAVDPSPSVPVVPAPPPPG